jgi:hypothetical protein
MKEEMGHYVVQSKLFSYAISTRLIGKALYYVADRGGSSDMFE